MWLRLSSSEDKLELLEIASELRKIGAKIEMRELIDFEREEEFVLEGKLSEIRKFKEREELGEKIERWEKRIEILRKILNGREIRYEEFLNLFLTQEYPDGFEFVKKFTEGQIDLEEIASCAEKVIELKIILDEVEYFLMKNGFEVGDFIRGNLPEDPQIILPVEEGVEGSKKLINVEYFPVWELYVDVLSLLGEEVRDERLVPILSVVSNILANLEKVEDLGKIREMCSGVIEEGNGEVIVNCEEIFDQMIRALEKAGLVRVSGKKIKMRKRQW